MHIGVLLVTRRIHSRSCYVGLKTRKTKMFAKSCHWKLFSEILNIRILRNLTDEGSIALLLLKAAWSDSRLSCYYRQ